MAIFKKKVTAVKAEPKETKAEIVATTEATPKVAKRGGLDLSMVLIRPHVTEKSTDLSEKNVYVFEIHQDANKVHVAKAVEKLYKVKPVKIAVVNIHPKLYRNPRNGRTQVKKHALKKAIVTIKAGDKIEII